MQSIVWHDGLELEPMWPEDVTDLLIDWSGYLEASVTITSFDPTADGGMSAVGGAPDGQITPLRLSAGVTGSTHKVDLKITCSDGQVFNRPIHVPVR